MSAGLPDRCAPDRPTFAACSVRVVLVDRATGRRTEIPVFGFTLEDAAVVPYRDPAEVDAADRLPLQRTSRPR